MEKSNTPRPSPSPSPKKVKRDLTLTSSLHQGSDPGELQALLKQERDYLLKRRDPGRDKPPPAATSPATDDKEAPLSHLTGLALSGGGIRSATFCFGAMQELLDRGVFKHIDFLSTVSGGGYTGAAYSAWRLRQARTQPTVASQPGQVQAQSIDRKLKTQAPREKSTINIDAAPPRTWDLLLPHLRKFSNYLSPTLGIGSPGTWRIFGTMARNLTIHWLTLIGAIVVVFASLLLLFRFLWLFSVASVVVGLVLIVCALFSERRGRIYVRDCPQGMPVLTPEQRESLGPADRKKLENCERLAQKVRKLMQSPRLLMFNGLTFYAIGAALGLVASTYQHFPQLAFAAALERALPKVGLVTLNANFWAAAAVVLISVLLVVVTGFCSEWRWSPRRWGRLFPKWRSVGIVLVVGSLALWFLLASYNGVFAEPIKVELLTAYEALSRPATWSLAGAWTYSWQTGVMLMLFIVLISVVIAMYSGEMDREEREWATRIVSVCLVAMTAWFAIAMLALGSAKLAVMLYTGNVTADSQLGGAGVTGIWLAISAWAARLGKTQAVQSVVQSHWKRILVSVGPWVFIVGLIVVTCVAAVLALLALSAKFSPPMEFGVQLTPAQFVAGVLWRDWYVAVMLGVTAVVFGVAGLILDPNEFSLHGFYRDRLTRCYLGASNADTPAPDSIWNVRTDDLPLHHTLDAVTQVGAPYHIVNTAVNLFGSKDLRVQQRHCDSFVLTPLHCGSWATNYALTPPGLYLGTALAISGGAVSSNSGLATQGAAIAALMTFFNMRLGYWFGNPRYSAHETSKRPRFAPRYLLTEAFSVTNEDRNFVNLSDGGHFENLGLYELVRRRCEYIIVVDSECDPEHSCSALAQAIRMVRIDFNVNIQINVQRIAPSAAEPRFAREHWRLGSIEYPSDSEAGYEFPDRGLSDVGASKSGKLLYIKSSLLCEERNGHISADVIEYSKRHPRFPHDTTADQFFTEPQFESYRKLGQCILAKLLEGTDTSDIALLFKDLERIQQETDKLSVKIAVANQETDKPNAKMAAAGG